MNPSNYTENYILFNRSETLRISSLFFLIRFLSHSVNFVSGESRNTILHASFAFEVGHGVMDTKHFSDSVIETDGEQLRDEDNVTAPWDNHNCFFLLNCCNYPINSFGGRKQIERENSLGSIKHARVNEVGADASSLDVAIMAIIL